MIVLDTHIWVWWVHGDSALSASTRELLDSSEQTGIAVSAISCWEVSKLVERGRLIELSPRICVESTQLPGEFRRDPADQIIVATARVLDSPLVTVDGKILEYPHVKLTPTNASQRL